MRHRLGHRLLSALLAVWFLCVGQEPPFAHPCAMAPAARTDARTATTSEATTAPSARGAVAAEAPVGHGAHASHGRTEDGTDGTEDARPGPDEGFDAPADCACIGHCCCVAPGATLPRGTEIAAAAPTGRRAPPPERPTAERAPDAPPRRHPFATGPPDTRAA